MSRNVEQSGKLSLIDRPLYDESFEYLKGLVDGGATLKLLRSSSLELGAIIDKWEVGWMELTGTGTKVTKPMATYDLTRSIVVHCGEFSGAAIAPGHHGYFDFDDANTLSFNRIAPGSALVLRAFFVTIQFRKALEVIRHAVTTLGPGQDDVYVTLPTYTRENAMLFSAGQTNDVVAAIDSAAHIMLYIPSEFEVEFIRGSSAGTSKVSWYLVVFA